MERKNKNGWQTLSSEIVHKNPWYKIQKDKVVLPNGDSGQQFIIKLGKTIFIVPIKNNKIIFVKQYRYVFDRWSIELPAGGVDVGETIRIAAKKELSEEAGYTTENIQEIGTFIPVSGVMEELDYVVVARDLEFVGQKLNPAEDGMEVIEIEIAKAYKMIEDGEIKDGQTISALMLAKKYIT